MTTEKQTVKHTPGPWKVVGMYARSEAAMTVVKMGDTFAEVEYRPGAFDESDANASLIAAAPELLAACREVAEWIDLAKQNYPEMAGLIRGMESARAAIAKAEGSAQ